MNNIRKIITERLENASLDYRYWLSGVGFDGIIESYFYKLEGQIEAYQDCLNLIPAPRTEADILKDFEKLGWYVADGYSKEYKLVLKRKETKQLYGSLDVDWYHYIFIKENSYRAESTGCWNTKGYDITIQEHKLLNELFICWRWL